MNTSIGRVAGGLAIVATLCTALPAATSASPLGFGKVHFSGFVRDYYFTRTQRVGQDRRAYALGGKLHFETTERAGLGTGASLFTAQPLGLNSTDLNLVDVTVPGTVLTTLGEAYLSYRAPGVQGKFGAMLVNTPWVPPSDSRIIPSTFEGLITSEKLGPFTFTMDRLNRFKNRTDAYFTEHTLMTTAPSPGVFILNGTYAGGPVTASLWYNNFYDIAGLAYGELKFRNAKDGMVQPYFNFQLGNEVSNGSALVGKVASNFTGEQLGVASPHLDVSLAYNLIPLRAGFFRGGGIASPYTSSYQTDPLYTTQMFTGLVEDGSGHAIKAAATYWSPDRRLRVIASRANYYLYTSVKGTPINDQAETDVDTTYFPTGTAKNGTWNGLAIRYRLGFENSSGAPQEFTYSRLMFEYDFN